MTSYRESERKIKKHTAAMDTLTLLMNTQYAELSYEPSKAIMK